MSWLGIILLIGLRLATFVTDSPGDSNVMGVFTYILMVDKSFISKGGVLTFDWGHRG